MIGVLPSKTQLGGGGDNGTISHSFLPIFGYTDGSHCLTHSLLQGYYKTTALTHLLLPTYLGVIGQVIG